jgi:aspartyl protease family protein
MLKLIGMVLGLSAMAFGASQVLMSQTKAPVASANAAAKPASAKPAAVQSGPRSVSLAADASGHFVADIRINGLFIKGLFDTGATQIALPLSEARRIGIDPPASDYRAPVNTASGQTQAARVKLREVRLESIVVQDVDALVIREGLEVTLIGMSFFKQLQSTEMRGAMLVLKQ